MRSTFLPHGGQEGENWGTQASGPSHCPPARGLSSHARMGRGSWGFLPLPPPLTPQQSGGSGHPLLRTWRSAHAPPSCPAAWGLKGTGPTLGLGCSGPGQPGQEWGGGGLIRHFHFLNEMVGGLSWECIRRKGGPQGPSSFSVSLLIESSSNAPAGSRDLALLRCRKRALPLRVCRCPASLDAQATPVGPVLVLCPHGRRQADYTHHGQCERPFFAFVFLKQLL